MLPEHVADLIPVHARQHDIEEDEIGTCVGHGRQGAQAIRRSEHLQVFTLQRALDDGAYRGAVIDHQHDWLIHGAFPSREVKPDLAAYSFLSESVLSGGMFTLGWPDSQNDASWAWRITVPSRSNRSGQRHTRDPWTSGLSNEEQSNLNEYLSDPHYGGPCPAPDPTLIPSYASGNGVHLEVKRPSVTIGLPTHRAFEKATGFSLEYTDRFDIRSVLQLLLDRGLVFTDNVRRAPAHLFTQDQINVQSVDLSDGEQLGLALFHLQTGQSDEKQRYSQVQALFSAVTKREFDVQVVRPDPSEPAAASNQGNRTRIDLITRSPWGDIPLEYSGAGIAEALFISAVIAGGRGQVVLLDEPASTMHPTMQSTLLQQLENHVGYQFLIATHSAHMVPADLLQQVSRVWLEGGTTRRAALDVSKMPPDILRNLKQDLWHATEARNLLFQRAVILVEGETEQHAFPVWFDKLGYSLPSRDISIYSVGSDTKFAPLVALLQQYAIPWTVVCDGKVYGSPGRVHGSTIAEQLTEAGIVGVPALDGLDFAQRRDALEPFGVFSLATSLSDEIEKLPIFAQHKVQATREAGRSKARRGYYIAMAHDCPPEIASLLEQIRQYLLKRGVTNA